MKRQIVALIAVLTGCADLHADGTGPSPSEDENVTPDEDAGAVDVRDGKTMPTSRRDAGMSSGSSSGSDASVDGGSDGGVDASITPPPPNTVRCTLGVDCDKVPFDCSGCKDGNECTDDVCEVNTATFKRTCSTKPLTKGLCVNGENVRFKLKSQCDASNPRPTFESYYVAFDFSNGQCYDLVNPYVDTHIFDVTQGFCCQTGALCGTARTASKCTKIFP